VRRAFRDVDPDLLVSGIRSMASHLEQGNAFIIFRIGALLSGLFGVMGLLLASIGLYGVIAYHVTQRSHEIGVRMALGARPSAIVVGVLARGARLASAGAAVGIVLTAAIGRFVRPLLLGVSPFDPAAYASVTLVLVAVALLASVVPRGAPSRPILSSVYGWSERVASRFSARSDSARRCASRSRSRRRPAPADRPRARRSTSGSRACRPRSR